MDFPCQHVNPAMYQKVYFIPDLDVLLQKGSLMISSASVSCSITKSVYSSLTRSTNILSVRHVPGMILGTKDAASPLLELSI